jgi:DNA-binding NarL/FixJ family response regulator
LTLKAAVTEEPRRATFAGRAEGEEMTGVNAWIRWTPEEEKRLLNLIAAGKSWTLISGSLKRSMKSVKFHAKTLAQKRPPRAEGEGKMTNDRMPGPTR